MVRKLKYHEQKLLQKVDFVSWSADGSPSENKVIRKYHIKKREHYTLYNKLSREIRELAIAIRDLHETTPFRKQCTVRLLAKMYELGLIVTSDSLERAVTVSASAFCRRRLPVVMVKLEMCPDVATATRLIQHGHVRVGPHLVTDPAFFVTRSLEDLITWTQSSAVRQHILNYANMRDDFRIS